LYHANDLFRMREKTVYQLAQDAERVAATFSSQPLAMEQW
jgi:hypothetical protein